MTTAIVSDIKYLPIQEILEAGGEVILRKLSKEKFIDLTDRFPELRMERETNGDIIIMTPIKGGSGNREANLIGQLFIWCKKHGKGATFSSSTGFDLPSGETRSPDAVWVSQEKMDKLQPEDIEQRFLPVVPDFVVELRSDSDRLKTLQKKMTGTWMAAGVRLGWLLDPWKETAWIYREDGSVEKISGFNHTLSGEEVLPGFELKLSEFKLFGKKTTN